MFEMLKGFFHSFPGLFGYQFNFFVHVIQVREYYNKNSKIGGIAISMY
jgi:hypothetical protein